MYRVVVVRTAVVIVAVEETGLFVTMGAVVAGFLVVNIEGCVAPALTVFAITACEEIKFCATAVDATVCACEAEESDAASSLPSTAEGKEGKDCEKAGTLASVVRKLCGDSETVSPSTGAAPQDARTKSIATLKTIAKNACWLRLIIILPAIAAKKYGPKHRSACKASPPMRGGDRKLLLKFPAS